MLYIRCLCQSITRRHFVIELQVVWRKLGDASPDAAPAPVPQTSDSTSSSRPNPPPRHSIGSVGGQHNNQPPRYGNTGGGTPPRYTSSSNSLDRVPDRKGM